MEQLNQSLANILSQQQTTTTDVGELKDKLEQEITGRDSSELQEVLEELRKTQNSLITDLNKEKEKTETLEHQIGQVYFNN
jgi:chromosome segregation ATPase